jgi:RND family efflux transporter MFP subunit
LTNQQSSETKAEQVSPSQKPQGRGLWLAVGAAAVIIGFVVYQGIHGRVNAESRLGEATEEAAIPLVSVVHPTGNTTTDDIVLPGNTQPFNDAAIYARTSGYLQQWFVDIGAHVSSGQLLAIIESPEIDRQLEQARADAQTAEANEGLAEITSTRYQNLLTKSAVSKQETDQAIHDLAARKATVASSVANVHRFEQLQSFERIYAPFAGTITVRNTDIGALIGAGSGGTPNELFHISRTDQLRIYVAVPEIDSRAAQTGARALITFDEYPGEVFTGTIVRDSDSINATSRTLNVEVDLNNAKGRIRTGAYAFVHLKMPERTKNISPALVIPANTLLFRSEGLRVGVVRDGHAELVPITIGRDFGSTVEVVAGLRAEDQVIVNPSDSLTAGNPIRFAK